MLTGRRAAYLVVTLAVLGMVGTAHAQVAASGRARSSFASLLDADLGLLTTGDTGPQSATEPNSFSATVAGATAEVPNIASVDSGASSTSGTTTGSNPTVISLAGQVTADVLNGTVQAVSTGAAATVSCRSVSGAGALSLLTIGNQAIDIPLNPQPNTVIDVAGVARVTLNRQILNINKTARTVSLDVAAAVIEVLSGGQLLTVILSNASSALANLDPGCPVFGGGGGLETTGGGHGGGGCALRNPSAPSADAWPIFLLTLLWVVYRWRRRGVG